MSDPHYFTIASYCSSIGWGGLEMNVIRFLHWMSERGWPVMLYAEPNSGIAPFADRYNVPMRGIHCGSDLASLRKAPTLSRMIADNNARVLIVHQSHDLLISSVARAWSRGQFKLIFSQNMHLGNKRDPIHAWQYRKIDAFVSPLPVLAEQAHRQTVVPKMRIHVIPHGIEQDRFVTRVDRVASRVELKLPVDETIIGCIGRLDPKKGQHIAIQALARIHKTGIRPHLLVVGDPTINEGNSYYRRLLGLVSDLKLTEYVHIRPYLETPETAYGAMDVFVLTSQSETYGLVTIEAMTSGLPVIGTRSGGTVDLISHEHNGLLFPPDDDVALAEALLRCLNDKPFAARLAAQAKQDALERYSNTRQCEAWEGLLRGLVA